MLFRPYSLETDVQPLAAILNQSTRTPVSAADLRQAETATAAIEGIIRRRLVAEESSGRMIGYADIFRLPWAPEGEFTVRVHVDATHRRKGLGTALLEQALRFAREAGATRLSAEVQDDDPDSLAFAGKRGFAIHRHTFASTLAVDGFDETPFLPALRRAEAAGLRFFSIAEIGATEEKLRRFYGLDQAASQDIPGYDDSPMPFADWYTLTRESDWFTPEGLLVAADGDNWVGLAAISVYREQESGYHNMTGVLPDYRGKGLATALKVLTIRFAREKGLKWLRTNNDSQNGPMVAINRKFGYEPAPGEYSLVRSEG